MSKPKIILFDVDGVLIRYRHNFTDELAEQGYKDAPWIMQPYYHADNTALYNEGSKTEEEVLEPFLGGLGWKGTVKDYLDAQCSFARQHLDSALIAKIQEVRAGGTLCYIATNQGPYQGRFLSEELLKDSFDGHYISCNIGCKKDMPEFWDHVLQDLEDKKGITIPWDMAYFDDSGKNIEVASGFGIQSFLFTGNLQFENDMNMLGFDIALNSFFS
jgi:FMN phosphatase YigB (HAD superfamily)